MRPELIAHLCLFLHKRGLAWPLPSKFINSQDLTLITGATILVYDTFQDWRTILIPKGSKLKLMPSYLFFISIALDTFKMTWKMIPYAKYWLEVHFSPIVRHFFKNNYFLQLFLNFPFLIIWNKKKYYVLKNLFHFTKLLIVFCFFLCYS